MINKIKIIGMIILGMVLIPASALAFDAKGGETLEIGKDEVINDDLLIAGANVRINGTVNGDIKAVGSIVEINGDVNGDVASAGSQLNVRGNIADDLYVAGGQVTIDNKIGDNAFVGGGTVYISDQAEIGRDLRVYGGMINLDAEVKGDLDAGAGQLSITNNIGGKVNAEVDELKIGSGVIINGDLSYTSPKEAEINSNATINGGVDWTKSEPQKYQYSQDQYSENIWVASFVSTLTWNIIKITSLMLMGLILLWLFPKEIRKITDKLAGDPGNSVLWGLLTCIVTPIIALGLLITIIGAPLSLLLISVYVIALYLAKVLVSLWLGRSLLLALSKKKEVSNAWSVVVGAIIIGILMAIPLLGFLTKIIVALFGIGVLFMHLREYFAKRK